MTQQIYALIEAGQVVNTTIWDGRTEDDDGTPLWAPPEGQAAVPVGDSGAGIGWGYDGTQFTAPPPPPSPPAPPAPPPPASVTMRQARLALLGAGLLDDVEAALDAMPEGDAARAARIEWDYAATVDRASPFTQQLAAALDLSDDTLDALFTVAAGL